MKNTIVAFSVTPLGVGESVADYVADAVKVVRDSGLPNSTDSMFTTLEGEWDEVMRVVRDAVFAVAAQAPRVSTVIKVDLRESESASGRMAEKVRAVEELLAAEQLAPDQAAQQAAGGAE